MSENTLFFLCRLKTLVCIKISPQRVAIRRFKCIQNKTIVEGKDSFSAPSWRFFFSVEYGNAQTVTLLNVFILFIPSPVSALFLQRFTCTFNAFVTLYFKHFYVIFFYFFLLAKLVIQIIHDLADHPQMLRVSVCENFRFVLFWFAV